MATAAVENQTPTVTAESKTARKKKAKAEAAAGTNGANHISTAAVPEPQSNENSVMADTDSSSTEHPYLKELQKQVRNINKKLVAMHKLDAIIAENPGVALDDLVAQRKINQDQKAAALKKPQLQSQLAELEERSEHYRKFDADYQIKFNKQRETLEAKHQDELWQVRNQAKADFAKSSSSELREKLLVFSQFLRAAAAKRNVEEDALSNESKAFEGVLLLVYGGDENAVDATLNLINGSDKPVPSIENMLLPVTYADVKKAAIEYGPFQAEEAWVDQVAEATNNQAAAEPTEIAAASSDPTIANAGLTELEAPNGIAGEQFSELASAAPVSAGDVGNLAGERWDDAAGTSGGAEIGGLEESYEVIPRPSNEVEVPAKDTQQPQNTSWADEPPSYESIADAGANQAGQSWDTKAPGEENGWGDRTSEAAAPPATDDDGFSPVNGRRGRGGNRGTGEFRGRGGRRGNFRGRGPRGDGEFRGGRGGYRGRGGPRGGSDASTPRP